MTTLRMDQISELSETIDKVRQKRIPLNEAVKELHRIHEKEPRFRSAGVIYGYFLSCIGLTLLYRPDLVALTITGSMGILVGIMVIWFNKKPRFDILLPVLAAIVVSGIVFYLNRLGVVYGSANLLITPLITFLPGALLTTGMIELASMHILSGSARLIYGVAVLLLLFFGISIGLNLSGLPSQMVYAYEAGTFPWWAPFIGTLLFGVGTFIRLSGANRDLLWMLVVLYVAMLSQFIGEEFFNSTAGAFMGAFMMTLSSEFIARSPRRTPAVVTQIVAFWFLVPGARGLLSVTSLLNENIQRAAIGLGEVVILIVAITLGVLLGTLIVSPEKFMPFSQPARLGKRQQ
jgi:uncharacterized membrane protein YjjP (DUF1212 family)